MLRQLIYCIGHAFFLIFGLVLFFFTGRNTERGYQALVFWFCLTKGRSNTLLVRIQSLFVSRLRDLDRKGLLGEAQNVVRAYLEDLRKKGYVSKNAALSHDECDRLIEFALSTPALVRQMDGDQQSHMEQTFVLFDPHNLQAVRYDYLPQDLVANPDIQNLMADNSLLALAESYLGTAPRLDVISMWWHTSFSKTPDSKAAQLYHFDLDRPRWLKVFIYLTDVGSDNGPHSFIEGSHRIGAIPARFLRRGYARLTDREVIGEYGSNREVIFTAPKGTVIVEDTIGLHKGNVVTGSPRLILQLQFSSSLFGTPGYARSRLPQRRTPELNRMIRSNPIAYQGFL